jgi:hypothetical protein
LEELVARLRALLRRIGVVEIDTDDEKIRRLISSSLRQDVKKAPVRLKIDSSRSLIKRLFSRFGEGGTTRQVPLYRFQDLCLRACHRSVSQDQINAAFKYAKSLDQKDEVSSSSLEESLDFTAFVNALFIVGNMYKSICWYILKPAVISAIEIR